MPERWRTELRQLERLHPDDDLIERARERPARPFHRGHTGRTVGAIAVATALTGALSVGGYAVLSERPTPNVDASAPTVIENGDLLFASNLETSWRIHALDPETGKVRALTHGVRDYGSDWSPDGTKIVYDTDDGDIVIANADGSNAFAVAAGENPSWSPDGTRLAYVHDGRIWVANVDGSNAHPITAGPDAAGKTVGYLSGYDWNPSWSPDGRSIAYTRLVSERLADLPSGEGRVSVTLEELRVWSADGTDVALTDDYAALGEIDWSPDGSTVVFTGAPTHFHEETTKGEVWARVLTVPSSGGDVTPLTPERERWIGGATWSPDGEWIAFQDDYETIALIRPDGSDRREIVVGYEVIGLSWGVEPQTA